MTVKDAEAERLAEIIAELWRIKVPTLYTGVVFEATELCKAY